MTDFMRLKHKPPSEWPDWVTDDVLKSVAKLSGEYSTGKDELAIKQNLWWRAFLLVSRDTDLPVSILLQLRKEALTSRGVLVLTIPNPTRDLVFHLRQDTHQAIEATFPPERSRLFPMQLHLETFRRNWWKIVEAAGLPRKSIRYAAMNRTGTLDFPGRPSDSEHHDERLIDFFENVYSPLKLRGKSANTFRLYHFTVRNFGRFLGRDPMLADLSDENVSKLLTWMASRGRAPHTVEKERCQLLAIWRFACQRGKLTIYPNVPRQKLPERVVFAWTKEELAELFKATRQMNGDIGGIPASDWWYALHCVIWDTGERIGAVLQLRWQNLDMQTRWLIIPAELRKGHTRDKPHRLHRDTIQSLQPLANDRHEMIFHWPYTMTAIYHRYNAVLKKAGLPTDARSKFHKMRRSVASHYEAAGGDATSLLDHSSRSVTTKHYLDPRIVVTSQASEVLFRPNKTRKEPTP